MAQRGKGLEERREWFTRVKALSERACRKAEWLRSHRRTARKGYRFMPSNRFSHDDPLA